MDRKELTTGEAEAWRAGWEAAQHSIRAVILELAAEARGFTEEEHAYEHAAKTIRAMEPPR